MIRSILLTSSVLATTASAQQFNLSAAANAPEFNINLNAQLATLDYTLQLRVPDTPEAIRTQPFFTEDGRKIHFRMLADPVRGFVIGTPVEGLELELLQIIDDGDKPKFVVIGRQNEVLYDLTEEDLFVTDLRFGEYCLKLQQAETSDLPLNVWLAVDISGSMVGVLSDVRQSLADFASSLPPRALCDVVVFDHELHYLDPPRPGFPGGQSMVSGQPLACSMLDDMAFLESAVVSHNGGTDIVTPMRHVYEQALAHPEELNLALVISDGAGRATRGNPAFRNLIRLREQAIEMSGVYSVVNWLGQFNQSYPLADLADYSLPGPVGNRPYAQDFFTNSRALLGAQSILTPVPCD